MTLPSDLRPIFYAARFFGCGPHEVAEFDIRVTKRGLVYSGCWSCVFLWAFAHGLYIIFLDKLEPKLLLLTIIRTVLCYVCLFSDIGLTIVWNWKLRAVLAQLRNFDEATKCGFTVAIFDAFTYAFINGVMSLQLMKFAGLVFLIFERFQRLGEMLLEPDSARVVILGRIGKQLRLQEVWWLHSTLANAMETVNSVYGTQLLFWIATTSFNTLSRIYTINETLNVPTILKAREALLVSACVANLLIIAIICHVTATKANEVAKVAFSPLSHVVGRRSFVEDNLEAATYFQLRQMHFFAGAGLIRIDLPLLLSIASGITTYLVILHAASTTG
ncbi:uncharacterized protein [Prorops nasuta]|uniref:uncharacterized protein n=1 Tax=Prorops nasuta TaxID=863751 RepID=UPI0034CE4677